MDYCSFFIKNKALFGSYPTQERVRELEAKNVKYFVDLTCQGERYIVPYKTKYTYISYPIVDRSVPKDRKSFSLLILRICKILDDLKGGELIYLGCRGGHGRSGLVVACVLCYYFKMSSKKALEMTNKYHSERKEMREKWRTIGSPQTCYQKTFVVNFFEPLYFYRAYSSGTTMGMSNFCNFSVELKKLGTFPTTEAAFNAFKDIDNKKYVNDQLNASSPVVSKRLGRFCKLRSDWNDVRYDIMNKIVTCKFLQHKSIRDNILNTGFRPIIMKTIHDNYWGCGHSFSGFNNLGKILQNLRLALYEKELDQQQLLLEQGDEQLLHFGLQ